MFLTGTGFAVCGLWITLLLLLLLLLLLFGGFFKGMGESGSGDMSTGAWRLALRALMVCGDRRMESGRSA